MARRYHRRNQLDSMSTGELVIGGLVLVGVVGGIIYLVTKSSSTTATTATTAAQPGDLTAQQLGIAAGTPASYLSGTTDQYGNPVVGD
jgi:uncharacterized membrane protein AbrB (regulator of aidB expression)